MTTTTTQLATDRQRRLNNQAAVRRQVRIARRSRRDGTVAMVERFDQPETTAAAVRKVLQTRTV